MRNHVIVKLQTVRTVKIDTDPKGKQTIGQHIDILLREAAEHGEEPNKLVLDLNPKQVDPADVESI